MIKECGNKKHIDNNENVTDTSINTMNEGGETCIDIT